MGVLPPWARRPVALWGVAVAACLAAGCGEEPAEIRLERWTLSVPGTGGTEQPVRLPADLTPHLPDRRGVYRLESEVALPPELAGRALQLVVPSLPARATLRAGGVEAAPLGGGLVSGHRGRGLLAFRIPAKATAEGGALTLELSVEHTWTQSGWVGAAPRLGVARDSGAVGGAVRLVNDVGGAVAAVALFQLGLTYLVVFLLGRRRRAYLWFALQGLTAVYYPLFVLGITQVFSVYETNLLAIMISAAPVVSVYFTHAHFRLRRPHWIWPALLAASSAVAVAVTDPFMVTQVVGKTTVTVVVLCALYQIYVCARMARRRPAPRGSRILLACWLTLTALASVDFAAWCGLGDFLGGARPACWGLAAFALLQSLLLSQEHFQVLNRSDELNAELGARVAQLERRQEEIEHLNQELRRQIADRSRQLFAALALIDSEKPQPPELAGGDVVQERYRVERVAGRGGMGKVYEVRRLSDGERLALKIAAGMDSVALARLAREAQIASEVSHPNLVGIVDVDVADSGFLYLVLEYVDGDSLRERPKPADPEWALSVLSQVAAGLSALHESGVVHRDLTPANVLLPGDPDRPEVKIADFGISRRAVEPESGLLADAEARETPAVPPPTPDLPAPAAGPGTTVETKVIRPETPPKGSERQSGEGGTPTTDRLTRLAVTQAGLLAGTPKYMPPEMAGDPTAVSSAGDVFSLGVIAYELLTGEPPFAEPPLVHALEGRDVPPPRPLGEACPALAREVIEILERCLDVDPARRPGAGAIREALRAA